MPFSSFPRPPFLWLWETGARSWSGCLCSHTRKALRGGRGELSVGGAHRRGL